MRACGRERQGCLLGVLTLLFLLEKKVLEKDRERQIILFGFNQQNRWVSSLIDERFSFQVYHSLIYLKLRFKNFLL